MRTLRYLLEKEFKQIRRDRFLPRIIFMIPIIQLLILPLAANFEMRNIYLSVVDNDHTATSHRLVDKVLSSGYFVLTDLSPSYATALGSVERNEADILLEIPAGTERLLGTEGQADLLIAANAVNGTKGGMGSSYLGSILQAFNHEEGYGATGAQLSAASPSFAIQTTSLYNPHLSYKQFMVPGILAFLMTIIGGLLSALNVVGEKEKGTIEQINVTPVPKAVFLLSKLIPFWVIGLVLLTIGTGVAWAVYGLVPLGGFWLIYLFAALYLVAFTGFGLAISAISATQQQAMFTAFFFLIIFMLLSGLFTPISSMPEWAQTLTLCNPLRYFIEVMRMVYMKGSTAADLTTHFAVIALFAVLFNALAVVGYRKRG